jgi:hypothetical protein
MGFGSWRNDWLYLPFLQVFFWGELLSDQRCFEELAGSALLLLLVRTTSEDLVVKINFF